MPQVIQCPECAKSLRVPDTFRGGSRVKCPHCGTNFTTPAAEGIVESPSPQPPPAPAPAEEPRVQDEAPRFQASSTAPLRFSGSYSLDIGPMFGEIGKHYGEMLGPVVGFIAICIGIAIPLGFLTFLLGCIPVVGNLFGGVINATVIPQLIGGGIFVTLTQMRGKPWTFGDFFAGFRFWLPLFLVALASYACYWIFMLPAVLVQLLGFLLQPDRPGDSAIPLFIMAVTLLLQLAAVCAYAFVWVRFLVLAPWLVVDHNLSAVEAIKANMALSQGHFWSWLGLSLLFGLIGVVGFAACLVPGLFTGPLYLILMTSFYLQTMSQKPGLPQSEDISSTGIKPATA